MDGLLALTNEHGIAPDEIEAVEIGLPETGCKIIGQPQDTKINPESVVDGQFSMPFCAAVVLREGAMGWDDYAKHLKDEDTRALCQKISTVHNAKAEAAYPVNMSGSVKIKTAFGEFSTFVEVPKGEPDNFMTTSEFRAKFDSLCAPYLDDVRRTRLADAILTLEEANAVASVFQLSQP